MWLLQIVLEGYIAKLWELLSRYTIPSTESLRNVFVKMTYSNGRGLLTVQQHNVKCVKNKVKCKEDHYALVHHPPAGICFPKLSILLAYRSTLL